MIYWQYMEKKNFQNYLSKLATIIYIILVIIALLILGAFAHGYNSNIETISPKGHQPIKAKVINADPAYFTINVKSIANLGVNENAPTFAVYISSILPNQCGNFLNLRLKYTKPEKHKRVFNLSKHENVLKAINTYKCVVIKNIPSE